MPRKLWCKMCQQENDSALNTALIQIIIKFIVKSKVRRKQEVEPNTNHNCWDYLLGKANAVQLVLQCYKVKCDATLQ